MNGNKKQPYQGGMDKEQGGMKKEHGPNCTCADCMRKKGSMNKEQERKQEGNKGGYYKKP